jgi:hypothetical protein
VLFHDSLRIFVDKMKRKKNKFKEQKIIVEREKWNGNTFVPEAPFTPTGTS